MRKAIKKEGKIVQAYRLGESGENHPIIDELMAKGLIKYVGNDEYQLFSQEAVNGEGEVAKVGDYVRIDSTGAPYPNSKVYINENFKHKGGVNYEQIPKQVNIWSVEDGMCPEIKFLMDKKGLVFDTGNEEKYFTAPLWGTLLSAAKNAVIVFYEIKKDDDGIIADVDFCFVEKNEFEKTYNVIS